MDKPLISLILSCSSSREQVAAMVEHITSTQPASRIELILVAWDGYDYSDLAQGFLRVRQINFSPAIGLNEVLPIALDEASADIVVCLEDHVQVSGPWVLELPELFKKHGCAAVGWTTLPGDVESQVSWAGYLCEYGIWGPGVPEGLTSDHLPGHNTAYDRATLLEYRDELENLFRAESLLHWRLIQDGKRLFFTTRFVLRHSQFLSAGKLYKANFWYGWNFGDARRVSRKLGPVARLFYAGAILLKPAIRWNHLMKVPREKKAYPPRVFSKTWSMISLAFVSGAVGEALGYILGPRQAPVRLTYYELGFDRTRVR